MKQEAQLSPRDSDALYQLQYRPTVVQITQTNSMSTRRALSATATFYCAICIVLYTHRCTKHNYSTASIQCRACRQQTSHFPTTKLAGVNSKVSYVLWPQKSFKFTSIFIFRRNSTSYATRCYNH